jgi:uncharacterized membrane protein YkvA (DUF1232 family)
MNSVVGFFQLLVVCGTVLMLTMLVLASLPKSKFRDVAMQVMHWTSAGFAGLYVASPVDIVPEVFLGPFGFIDDLFALAVCIVSVQKALAAGRAASARELIEGAASTLKRMPLPSREVRHDG